jgi:hypothetical protein
MITREKEKESIPNINWLQLLGLNNFTEEVLDLKKKDHYLISNSMPISKQQA